MDDINIDKELDEFYKRHEKPIVEPKYDLAKINISHENRKLDFDKIVKPKTQKSERTKVTIINKNKKEDDLNLF